MISSAHISTTAVVLMVVRVFQQRTIYNAQANLGKVIFAWNAVVKL